MQCISNRRKAFAKSERALAAFVLAGVLFSAPSWAAAWDEKYYNPKPLPDDVLLPTPCNGFFVLRKVQIPLASASPMDDRGVTLGQDGDDWGYIEQARPSYIAGSFTVSNSASRHYLLAKYELSELQYRAIVNGDGKCPVPSTQLLLPKTGLSWFDAVALADRYNLWLRKNAGDKLPKEDGMVGFLRLPTEAEWEFAARGGDAVSQAEFRDLRFPTPEGGLGTYAWFAGAQSANGKPQLIGRLKPNPLGLHDMLGNVDEMIFEPFRLNKLNREHGQAGGYIVRGGHYQKPQAELRTALREEKPYYSSTGDSTRPPTSGVRLALVAPVLTSHERIKQVEQDWKKLGTGKEGNKAEPLKEMAAITSNVRDDSLKQQLEKLRTDLRANAQARDEQRDKAIVSELQLGTFLCTKLKDDGKFLDTLEANYASSCGSGGEEPAARCEMRGKQLERHREVLNFMLDYYADSVVSSAQNYGYETIEPQVAVVEQQLDARRKSNLRAYLKAHRSNLVAYLKNGKVERNQWLQSCKTI